MFVCGGFTLFGGGEVMWVVHAAVDTDGSWWINPTDTIDVGEVGEAAVLDDLTDAHLLPGGPGGPLRFLVEVTAADEGLKGLHCGPEALLELLY